MKTPIVQQTKPNYGIDAPDVVRNLTLFGGIGVVLGLLTPWLPTLIEGITPLIGISGVWCVVIGCAMLWGSKVGKFHLRDKVLNSIAWRGDEAVLDVGCGHGLMLIGAAKHLTTGHATGIDLWQQQDQANNSPEATMHNAQLEGVADRVEVRTGDARSMPFEDATFDVIVSSWALHNIYNADERAKALAEIVRVLKPGGQIALVDIRHGRQYAEFFRQQGLEQVQVGFPNFLFFTPTLPVYARKPA